MTCRERLMFYIYNYVFVILIYNCLPRYTAILLNHTAICYASLHYQGWAVGTLLISNLIRIPAMTGLTGDIYFHYLEYNGYRLVYLPSSKHSLEIIWIVFVEAGRQGRQQADHEEKTSPPRAQPTINN